MDVVKMNDVIHSIEILYKVVIEKLKKNYEIDAVDCFVEIKTVFNKVLDKTDDKDSLNKFYNDKNNLIYEFAKANNCFFFIRNFDKLK